MKAKPSPNRHTFTSPWDEVGYLYDKVLYWLYDRQNKIQASRFAVRLGSLLAKVDRSQESIWGQECRSLIWEIKGNLRKAILHRLNEIKKIRRLREISLGTPTEDYVLRGYGYEDLSDRLDLLAVLYHDNGELDKAIATLNESKRLCNAQSLEFDGDDLLRDYLDEKRMGAKAFSKNGTITTKYHAKAIEK